MVGDWELGVELDLNQNLMSIPLPRWFLSPLNLCPFRPEISIRARKKRLARSPTQHNMGNICKTGREFRLSLFIKGWFGNNAIRFVE